LSPDRRELVETLITKGNVMEPNQQTDADTELVTESLVEEVSIDGMCGVY
jgi:mycofactocin precursor peptide MftA